MRALAQIDADLDTEWLWLDRERRNGEGSAGVRDAKARVDALLDERSDVVHALSGAAPSAVDARLV